MPLKRTLTEGGGKGWGQSCQLQAREAEVKVGWEKGVKLADMATSSPGSKRLRTLLVRAHRANRL